MPNKGASPQASERCICDGGSFSPKKRIERDECKAHKKAAPQFANANEEAAYRSATQQSPAICAFYQLRMRRKSYSSGLATYSFAPS